MTFKKLLSTTVMLAVFATTFSQAEQAETVQTSDGYSYKLYTKKPSVDDLGQFPPQYEDPTAWHVMQGDNQTLVWRNSEYVGNVDKASFALGERHMGLFVPRWPQDKPASDSDGWTRYGDKLSYRNFSVSVERGEGDRELAGGMAQHYVLTADYIRHLEIEASASRHQMHMDLWILTDKPFSFVPYRVDGGFSDPRFDAALVEKLSELGMVVRSDARYSRVSVDEDGEETGFKHESTLTTWVDDLEPAEVPVAKIVVGDETTLEILQAEFRKKPDENCQSILAGSNPDFITQTLNSDQQAPVVNDLREFCKSHIMRPLAETMRDNPQSVCPDILAGKTPEVVIQVLDEDEQKDFMKSATSFCEKQAE